MNAFDVAQDFIELCQSTKPPTNRLTAGFRNSVDSLGFRYFAFCSHVDPLHPPPQATMLHNYPAAWVQHYSADKLYEFDPVLRRAECEPVPFFWDTAFKGAAITRAQRKMLVDAATFGIVHGYTIPIHLSWLPRTLRASCTVVPEKNCLARRNYFMVEAMAATLYAVLNRAGQPHQATSDIQLSHRERQCLSLAAQGKDDWTIGRLVHLSPNTVRSYIRRLMERIGVGTRMQAVVWALDSGQISFGDVTPARAPSASAN